MGFGKIMKGVAKHGVGLAKTAVKAGGQAYSGNYSGALKTTNKGMKKEFGKKYLQKGGRAVGGAIGGKKGKKIGGFVGKNAGNIGKLASAGKQASQGNYSGAIGTAVSAGRGMAGNNKTAKRAFKAAGTAHTMYKGGGRQAISSARKGNYSQAAGHAIRAGQGSGNARIRKASNIAGKAHKLYGQMRR